MIEGGGAINKIITPTSFKYFIREYSCRQLGFLQNLGITNIPSITISERQLAANHGL